MDNFNINRRLFLKGATASLALTALGGSKAGKSTAEIGQDSKVVWRLSENAGR